MAQGRGNATSPFLLLLLLSFHSCCWLWQHASATTYTVGGASQWNVGVDYTQWVAVKTFKVGDILFFPYIQTEHNVVVVDKTGYNSCTAAASATTYSAGNTNITLSAAGDHYYLCSVIGHCAGGMKLAVTVAAAAAPPTSAPAPAAAKATPPTSPKSAPKATPVSAPGPASAAPPASSPTPSSVTAPAPSPTTPAPVPAPGPSAQTPGSSIAPSAAVPSSSSPPGPPSGSPPPLPSSAPSLYRGIASLFVLLVPVALLPREGWLDFP